MTEPISTADVLHGADELFRVIVLAAEHLASKGRGCFITPLSGGVGSGGVDDVALGKHGLCNTLA